MGNPGIICLQQNLQMGIGLAPSFGVRRRTAVGRPQIQKEIVWQAVNTYIFLNDYTYIKITQVIIS